MHPTKPCSDRPKALAQYRMRASVYDHELAAFEPIRRRAIASLSLQRGATVLDVGCGTGLSFEQLQQAIGPQGRIIGIEQCPEMMEQAHHRVVRHGWQNVTLLNAPVEACTIAVQADAALFHFTHDILQTPEAISNVVHHLKPGARVVAAGLQWASPWAWGANWFVLMAALHSVSTVAGLDQPWSRLARQVGRMQVSSTLMDCVYIASGVVAPRGWRPIASTHCSKT